MNAIDMLNNVKIGAVNYSIKEVHDLHRVESDGKKTGLHGQILYTTCQISIEKEQAHDVNVSTLWHEIVHGILTQAGQNEQDENHICALGYGLVQVLRDNPELISFTVNGKTDDTAAK